MLTLHPAEQVIEGEIRPIELDAAALCEEYPELEEEDIRQALAYAAANLDDRVVPLAEAG